MSDRIELTDDELAEAVKIMTGMEYGLVPMGGGYRQSDGSTLCHMNDRGAAKAIRMAVDAVNRVRAGDPVLTIRKQPNRGRIAIRCEDEDSGEPFWLEVVAQGYSHRVGASIARTIETGYPIIYSPEEK